MPYRYSVDISEDNKRRQESEIGVSDCSDFASLSRAISHACAPVGNVFTPPAGPDVEIIGN